MTGYWVIAPFDSTQPELWEKIWQFNLENNVISIGWREIGDASNLDEQNLREVFENTYGHTKSLNTFWNFYHKIQVGDIVIARRGRKKIAAIGTVIKQAYFDKSKNASVNGVEHVFPNHIDIQWMDAPRNIEFDNIVFGMQTVYEISKEKYLEFIGDSYAETSLKVESDVENVTEFVLEKYLEDFIVSNFVAIFHGKLILYRDPEDNVVGQQYMTDEGVGRIDILAKEKSTDSFVVIEIKKGRETDKVVGQTLRYMGWVKENLCKGEQSVRGIIICKDSDTRLSYALTMTNNITVKYYHVDFKLGDNPFTK